jgi:diguanylate cyclase (GGDEF)-like protein
MLHRLLDGFATRFGVVIAVLAGFVLCLSAGVYFQSGANRVLKSHEVFRQNHVRDGFVSISDMLRLTLVVDELVASNALTPALHDKLLAALDILYVRARSLETRESTLFPDDDAETPSDAIFALVDFVDGTMAAGVHDIAQLKLELLWHIENTRSRLVTFLDKMRRQEDKFLDQQAREVEQQARVVGVIFLVLAAAMSISLILLRKEIVARHARARAERRADYLAYFDALTTLPNRIQFTDKVEKRLKKKLPTGVLLLDLDGFKAVNDTYGHAAGDAVLKTTGDRVAAAIAAQGGIAARLSGDEYAVCVPFEDVSVLEFYADSLLEALCLPIDFEGERLEVQASIGVVASEQVARCMGLTFSNMMRAGDFALYASKEGGKGRYTVYDDALEVKFSERRGMLEDLEAAISDGGLDVYLQPKVHLPSAVPYGFEALVRWQRDGKFVSPDIFVTLAEEAGLVMDIDLFMLSQATRIIAERNAAAGATFSVSVNLSALHFNGSNIVEDVQTALERSGLPPEFLTLEITETVQIHDWERVRHVLAQLGALGCKIAIDDFGSGYSSLAYLRNMLADELKVDRTLIEEIVHSQESQHVLRAICELSSGLDMSVIVEGIEDIAQSEVIQKIGCARAQGYLYGRPEPAELAIDAALIRVAAPQTYAS